MSLPTGAPDTAASPAPAAASGADAVRAEGQHRLDMLAAVGPEHEDEAHVLCAECRAKHGGWCIDELGPQGRSMCPLDLLAMSVTGSDRPATG